MTDEVRAAEAAGVSGSKCWWGIECASKQFADHRSLVHRCPEELERCCDPAAYALPMAGCVRDNLRIPALPFFLIPSILEGRLGHSISPKARLFAPDLCTALRVPMSQPSTSTSASTALPLPNQQAPATSHPSWPRRRPPRGKTVPHQTPNPIPPGPITAPLFSDADPALIRVIIKAYGLPWDKLKTYLESQLNCDLSQLSPPAVSAPYPRPTT